MKFLTAVRGPENKTGKAQAGSATGYQARGLIRRTTAKFHGVASGMSAQPHSNQGLMPPSKANQTTTTVRRLYLRLFYYTKFKDLRCPRFNRAAWTFAPETTAGIRRN